MHGANSVVRCSFPFKLLLFAKMILFDILAMMASNNSVLPGMCYGHYNIFRWFFSAVVVVVIMRYIVYRTVVSQTLFDFSLHIIHSFFQPGYLLGSCNFYIILGLARSNCPCVWWLSIFVAAIYGILFVCLGTASSEHRDKKSPSL